MCGRRMTCASCWITPALVLLSASKICLAFGADDAVDLDSVREEVGPRSDGWIVGPPGASCNQVCNRDYPCNAATMQDLNSHIAGDDATFSAFMETLGVSCAVFGECTEPQCSGAHPMVYKVGGADTCLSSHAQQTADCEAALDDGGERVCCCGFCLADNYLTLPSSPTPTPCPGAGWKLGLSGQSCNTVCAQQSSCACNAGAIQYVESMMNDPQFHDFMSIVFDIQCFFMGTLPDNVPGLASIYETAEAGIFCNSGFVVDGVSEAVECTLSSLTLDQAGWQRVCCCGQQLDCPLP